MFTESDLFDYPNLFLKKEDSISAVFPHPILEQQPVRDRDIRIIKEADYIASTSGTRTYPWRLWMIDDNNETYKYYIDFASRFGLLGSKGN